MKYTTSFRNSVLKKILPPSNRSVTSVSKETGVAEDKQDILDFIDFYVVLGIVHQKTHCRKENCHPDFVHSDNGKPMKGITLCAFYYQLEVLNPYERKSA